MGILRVYKSEIYGNYRREGCLNGLYAGLLLALYLLVRWLANVPTDAPQTYGSDGVMLVTMLVFTYLYRCRLPEQKATLKELMSLCMWHGVVASLLFGMMTGLYAAVVDTDFLQRCISRMVTDLQATDQAQPETVAMIENYTVGTMAFIAAFRSFVMSILWAFLTALLFRNEQSDVVRRGLFAKRKKKANI